MRINYRNENDAIVVRFRKQRVAEAQERKEKMMATFRSKYGYTLCPAPLADKCGFGYTASRPIKRISRCTRLRLTLYPYCRSQALMPRLPRNG